MSYLYIISYLYIYILSQNELKNDHYIYFLCGIQKSKCFYSKISSLGDNYGMFGQICPHQWSIDALNTTTPNLADLMAYLLADLPPPQLSIDALNTATPNLADILADLPPINQT